jgi:myo-inositol 2-dehydrogenase/D-chiro-inositol 1-dehydrogenase
MVGLGGIGKIHLSNVQRYRANAKVIVACPVKNKDESFLKLNAVHFHFESYKKMIKVKNIDAVIIASPTAFHFDHIMIAMNEGKYIFCEKPVDLSCKKVEMLKELINESGIQFMVGFNRRFDPHINQLKNHYNKTN